MSAPPNRGRTLYAVQQILGQSDPSVTARYVHLSLDALRYDVGQCLFIDRSSGETNTGEQVLLA